MNNFLGKYIKSQFLYFWILANIGGAFLANGVNLLALLATESLQMNMLFKVLLAFGVGAAVGFCQWLVLRRVVQNAYLWIILTAFSSAVAVVFTMVIDIMGGLLLSGSRQTYNFLALLLFLSRALPVSLLQWLFLRDHVRKAWLWIVFSLLAQGWLPRLLRLDGLRVPMEGMSIMQVFLAMVLWGLFTGLITGIPIVKFADRSAPIAVNQD